MHPNLPLPFPLNEKGPLLAYLEKVHGLKTDAAGMTVEAVRRCLNTPDGAILLDLLDKSILFNLTPTDGDGRALVCRNAQSFIASDLKRILGNESDALLEPKDDAPSAGRRGGRHAGSIA